MSEAVMGRCGACGSAVGREDDGFLRAMGKCWPCWKGRFSAGDGSEEELSEDEDVFGPEPDPDDEPLPRAAREEAGTRFEARDGGLFLAAFGERRRVVAAWESFTGWFWFAVEKAGEREWFGFVQGFEDEWGYFSERELEPLIRQGLVWRIKDCDLPFAGKR